MQQEDTTIKEVDQPTLERWLQAPNPPLLLDVREPHERAQFHIGGAFIPLNEIMQRHAEIPNDRPVVVYCRKGVRSAIAIQRLQARLGYQHLYNLKGGLAAWRQP
jgi:adenylyltransferase/sulfurtransferase